MDKKEDLKDLWPGQSHELLKALHILTRDGKLNQDSRRKLKQVQHLVQLIEPGLENQKTIVDLGAGKSYLGFMLYDLWMRDREETKLFAIESRESLIKSSREIAVKSGFSRIEFILGTIQEARALPQVPSEVDVVTALHACDTATDDSIIFALEKKSEIYCTGSVLSGGNGALVRHSKRSPSFGRFTLATSASQARVWVTFDQCHSFASFRSAWL